MKIAVIGTGGVGGSFGAALAKAGANLTFVARGAHLAAMQENGLRVEGGRGETVIRPVQATDNIAHIGAVDIVLFCVKLWDVEAVGSSCARCSVRTQRSFRSRMGWMRRRWLVAILGRSAVMSGTVAVSATIDRPGVILQSGKMMSLTFGEIDGRMTPRAERFHALCDSAGSDVALSGQYCRSVVGEILGFDRHGRLHRGDPTADRHLRDDPEIFAWFESVMRETEAVGRAEGVALPADTVDKLIALTKSLPPQTRASMAVDLSRGNRLELAWLAGKVVELAGSTASRRR